MAKYYVLITVGNRDVKIGKAQIKKPFSEGKKILENWDEYREKIRLPLVESFIKTILDNIKYEIKDGGVALRDINKFFLFVTNQKNIKNKGFREKDTLYFGEIIKKILIENYKVSEGKIVLIEIEDISTIKSFASKIKSVENQVEDGKAVFAEISGGIPFINYTIAFRLTYRLREKFKIFNIDEAKNVAMEKGLAEEIIKYFERETIIGLIEKYQYSACMEFELSNDEKNVFEFLNGLKNMDREKVEYYRNKICNLQNNRFNFICNFKLPKSLIDYLLYLYYSMELKVKTGEYVDFLGRLYSFRENILKLFLNIYCKYPLEAEDHIETHRNFIDSKPAIKKYLKNVKFGDRMLNYYEPNKVVFIEILKYLAENDKKDSEILVYINKFNKILEYRNKTIIGHEFRGCSKETINSLYKGGLEELLEDLKTLLKKAGYKGVFKNIFDEINEELINFYGKK